VNEVLAGERFPSRTYGVDRIAFAGSFPWWPFGTAHLHHLFALVGEERGQPGTVIAGAFHRSTPCSGSMPVGELHQLPIASSVGGDLEMGQDATNGAHRGSRQGVAMRIHADDGVDRFSQSAHADYLS
jgi:hypothetical protein